MKKTIKFVILAMAVTMLFGSMTVNAAEVSTTAKQNADYMMSTNKEGVPNWFNGAFYSDSYSDLKIAFGTNEKELYNHSLQYGFNEARLVTPVLDVAKYRANNPDLQKAFGNNWELYVRHYFEFGIAEGRENFTDFDARTYLSMYTDLQNAFGADLGLATRHYIEYGITEGRECQKQEPVVTVEKNNNNISSDNGSSDDNGSGELLNGTVTEEYSDGSYVVYEYVDGKPVSRIDYNANNEKMLERTYTYDGNGNCIKDECYDAVSDHTVTMEYTYDEQGNKIKITQYDEGALTYTTTIEYDSEGNEIRAVEIDNLGNVNRTIVYDRYDDGYLKSETYYYGETQKKEREILYHENGMMKSDVSYDLDGAVTSATYWDEDGNEIPAE